MPDEPEFRFRSARRIALGCLAAALVFIILQIVFSIVQLGPDPANWSRREGQISSYGDPVYIHLEAGGTYRLSDDDNGAVGMLSAYRIRRGIDDSLLFTSVIERAKLDVIVEGMTADVSEYPQWRELAAAFYDAPELRDTARHTRTIIFGYPLDWLRAIGALIVALVSWTLGASLVIAIFAAIIYIPIAISRAIAAATDPEVRRLATLQQGLCPKCKYIIRHLPQCRCPECGEQWSAADLHPAALQRARIAARTGKPAPPEPATKP